MCGSIDKDGTHSALGNIAAFWGLLGVILLLGAAVYRLSFWAIDAFNYPFSLLQWVIFVGYAIFMAISEGYKGFQKGFSPRVAARALYLSKNPSPKRFIFAPLFCMGFFGATRKRKITTWILTLTIIGLIIIIKLLPQPWRGIIDFGVVLGLTWGLISLILYAIRAFVDPTFSHCPEVA